MIACLRMFSLYETYFQGQSRLGNSNSIPNFRRRIQMKCSRWFNFWCWLPPTKGNSPSNTATILAEICSTMTDWLSCSHSPIDTAWSTWQIAGFQNHPRWSTSPSQSSEGSRCRYRDNHYGSWSPACVISFSTASTIFSATHTRRQMQTLPPREEVNQRRWKKWSSRWPIPQ